MINVAGRTFQWNELIEQVQVSSTGRNILQQLDNSPGVYRYRSFAELENTILIREQIMNAAKKLNNSSVSFAVFSETRANDRYWTITEQGGIRLRPGVKSSIAIRDIYQNGTAYAFECATAMIILYYYAALEYLGAETFDNYFKDLYLYSWVTDSDLALDIATAREPIPGDVVYFDNPDHRRPEWQGENAVFLGDDRYYGHGMGILSAEAMIEQLNLLGESSEVDATMLDKFVRPNFRHWMDLKYRNSSRSFRTTENRVILYQSIYHHNLCSISYPYYRTLLNTHHANQLKITMGQ
ncbi:protein-glutamine gamma-glutamyltransferase [Virgibacillus phasianinus]|uniref:Protein-glutamine gamma-glutamyltransferase n=1 Tax=Virgibacillus phasianinus TaxID=2017483 RepID=A0A220U6Y2_9BACI|nr:protein-glutamine gamma-glutamyltransferase [Virgibacillus phasianinus]ASK64064.1 protein-glutamine gamma-glutamyltransferase [Virgibacillus phasianinus]